MPHLYVVLCDTGEYSDRTREVIGVATSEWDAMDMAERHAAKVEHERHESAVQLDADDFEDVGWQEKWQPAVLDRWGDPKPMQRHFEPPSGYERGHYEITEHILNQE